MKKRKGFNVELVIRGRGTPKNKQRYTHGTPVKQANKVAIYVNRKQETGQERSHRIHVESLEKRLRAANELVKVYEEDRRS